MAQLENIEAIEKRLWGSADNLRAKPDLSKAEIDRIKKVADKLCQTLSAELQRIENFAAKQATRDEIKIMIKDFLWEDKTGLPESIAPEEVEDKTEAVFRHLVISQKNRQASNTWKSA